MNFNFFQHPFRNTQRTCFPAYQDYENWAQENGYQNDKKDFFILLEASYASYLITKRYPDVKCLLLTSNQCLWRSANNLKALKTLFRHIGILEIVQCQQPKEHCPVTRLPSQKRSRTLEKRERKYSQKKGRFDEK